ncbi:hypothetical protein SAMN04488543_0325 [Friedmanniella luteola]|uniref:Uncharacterized protein n=1 Tax=Friedmanniella luteola TaxID=546871 RepID=A0A1H1LL90_9ACTN|nr:hypothetical protein [Friedmanniella luteola]SDR75112.1 hypothetical protein SAMN04488543_0325 [Friedmanniella luteola]
MSGPPGTVVGRSRLGPLRERVVELARSTPRALPSLRPRRRRVQLGLGPTLPGWLLRGLLLVLTGVAVTAAGAGTTLLWIGLLLGLGPVVRPRGAWPVAVVGFVAFVQLTAGDGAWRPGAFVALAASHLLVQLAALLGPFGWSVRVEPAVLLVLLRRYLPVQAATQLVALLGAVVAQGRVQVWWLAPLAALAVGALVVVLAPRLTARPRGADATPRPTV